MSVERYTTHVHMLYISVPEGNVSVGNLLFRSEYLFGVLFLHYVIYFCSEATTPGYFVRPYIRP